MTMVVRSGRSTSRFLAVVLAFYFSLERGATAGPLLSTCKRRSRAGTITSTGIPPGGGRIRPPPGGTPTFLDDSLLVDHVSEFLGPSSRRLRRVSPALGRSSALTVAEQARRVLEAAAVSATMVGSGWCPASTTSIIHAVEDLRRDVEERGENCSSLRREAVLKLVSAQLDLLLVRTDHDEDLLTAPPAPEVADEDLRIADFLTADHLEEVVREPDIDEVRDVVIEAMGRLASPGDIKSLGLILSTLFHVVDRKVCLRHSTAGVEEEEDPFVREDNILYLGYNMGPALLYGGVDGRGRSVNMQQLDDPVAEGRVFSASLRALAKLAPSPPAARPRAEDELQKLIVHRLLPELRTRFVRPSPNRMSDWAGVRYEMRCLWRVVAAIVAPQLGRGVGPQHRADIVAALLDSLDLDDLHVADGEDSVDHVLLLARICVLRALGSLSSEKGDRIVGRRILAFLRPSPDPRTISAYVAAVHALGMVTPDDPSHVEDEDLRPDVLDKLMELVAADTDPHVRASAMVVLASKCGRRGSFGQTGPG